MRGRRLQPSSNTCRAPGRETPRPVFLPQGRRLPHLVWPVDPADQTPAAAYRRSHYGLTRESRCPLPPAPEVPESAGCLLPLEMRTPATFVLSVLLVAIGPGRRPDSTLGRRRGTSRRALDYRLRKSVVSTAQTPSRER